MSDDDEILVLVEEGPFAGQRIKFKKLLPCPCGKSVHQSLDPPALVHGEPRCAKFDQLEPLEFLQWMRRTYGIPDSEGHVN